MAIFCYVNETRDDGREKKKAGAVAASAIYS
jgi:hypothetical protein